MCGTSRLTGASGTGEPIQAAPIQQGGHVAGANGGGHAHQAHGARAAEPKIPSKDSPIIRKYLADGSYGPTVKKGRASTIRIDDGKGFGDVRGRKQNGNDRKQNNYSVTDANFYPSLGVLNDVRTGRPLNYVKQIQAYNAAGYISTFHPATYAKMVAAQDAGQGTVLGMSLNLMGIEGAQTDPGMSAAGLTAGQFANENVPGSPLNARKVVMSGRDLAGEEWARPHHAESSWAVYRKLNDVGIDWKTSMVLSGDDAVSGSGRLNGFNNQDGKDSFNDDEAAVFRMAAVVQRATGKPVLQIVAGGHSHTGIDASARTKPNINRLMGLPHGDTSNSPERMARLEQVLLDGTIRSKGARKFAVDGTRAFDGAGGTSEMLAYAISQVASNKGDGDRKAGTNGTTPAAPAPEAHTIGAGPGAPDVAVGGGCNMDPKRGAKLLGGGPELGSIGAVLEQLMQALDALVAALSAGGVAGTSGGGSYGDPARKAAVSNP